MATHIIAADELESLLPSVPTMALLLKKYEDNGFLSHELLKVMDFVDLTDEGGRRQLTSICKELMLSPTIPESVIPLLMKQLVRVCKDEDTFIQLVLEIISDVREPLDIFSSPEAELALKEQV
jgi:hypothetical protein